MAKKCIPGVICIENMTLFISIILCIFVLYLWIQVGHLGNQLHSVQTTTTTTTTIPSVETSIDIRSDPGRCGNTMMGDTLTNPYIPPIRCNNAPIAPVVIPPIEGKYPINIPTQRMNTQYSQVGILTKQNGKTNHPDILPLMGRPLITARQKWQYYTINGGGPGGNLQTKLPIYVKGKNGSSEYGCEEIYNNDEVVVEGFPDKFIATIYESGLFSYLPY
jgi:hypothetical protein